MTGEIRECQSLSKRLNELMYSLEIAAFSLGKMHFRQNPGKINSFCPPNPPVWILGGACDFVAFKQNSHKKKKEAGECQDLQDLPTLLLCCTQKTVMLQNALLILTLTHSHQHCVLPCSEGKPAPTPPGFHTHETLSPSQGQCPLGMLPCWGHSWINIFHSSASQGNSATEQTEEESKFPYLSASREVSSAPD